MAAEDYEIRSSIPVKTGEKFRYWGELKDVREESVMVGGELKDGSSEKKVATLQGTVEILIVDEDGDPVKSSLTVQSMNMVRNENEKSEIMLPAGTVLIAEFKDKRTVYSIKDTEVSPELARTFKQLFNLLESKEIACGETIGTKMRRKTVEQWPVNAEAVVKDFSGIDAEFKKEDVTGSSRIVNASRWGLEVATDIEVKNVTIKNTASLKDMGFKSTLRLKISNTMPTSEGLSFNKGKSTMISGVIACKTEKMAPDGRKVEMNFSYGMTRSVKYSLIK